MSFLYEKQVSETWGSDSLDFKRDLRRLAGTVKQKGEHVLWKVMIFSVKQNILILKTNSRNWSTIR